MAQVAIYVWDNNEDSIPKAIVDETTTPPETTIIQGQRKVFDDTEPGYEGILEDMQEYFDGQSVYGGNPNTWPPPKPF